MTQIDADKIGLSALIRVIRGGIVSRVFGLALGQRAKGWRRGGALVR